MDNGTLRLFVGIAIEAVRESGPVVRCQFPPTTAGLVGQMLAAVGASPDFSDAASPILAEASAVAVSDTYVPNTAAHSLAGWANEHSVPWVLQVAGDPGASGLADLSPTIVRGAVTPSVSVLPGDPASVHVDQRVLRLGLPHAELSRIFGAEEMVTALTAACASVAGPLEAAVAATAWVALAAERAAEHARGPGSLRAALIDELTLLGGDEVAERVDFS